MPQFMGENFKLGHYRRFTLKGVNAWVPFAGVDCVGRTTKRELAAPQVPESARLCPVARFLGLEPGSGSIAE